MNNKQVFLVIKIKDINEPEQPIRSAFGKQKFEELCESIKRIGLIEPIVVNKKNGIFTVVAGHRRYLACKELGMDIINCVLIGSKEVDCDAVMLDENIIREDVHPYDEALYFQKLMVKNKINEYDLAEKLGKSKSYVFERIAILKYPDILRKAFVEGKINHSKARELYKIRDIEGLEMYLDHAIKSGASSDVIKRWVSDYNSVQQEQDVEVIGDLEGTSRQEVKVESVECHMCGSDNKLDDTRIVRICYGCLGALTKVE